jgi:hypothetical protein
MMKAFRNYMVILLVMAVTLSIYIPVHYDVSYPRQITPKFDTYVRKVYLEDIELQHPDAVLLGDSMVNPAVDSVALGQRLNLTFYPIGLPGSASTLWYLILKNNIIEASPPPKYMFIIFRDTMMTVPGYRVTGRYLAQIDEFASPKDEVLIQRAYLDQMNPLEKVSERYLPLYGSRWNIREGIDSRIRYTLPQSELGCAKPCMDNAMEVVFGSLNIDLSYLSDAIAAADDYLYTRTALNFDGQINDSFLPEIIRLCKDNNVQLVLVRMRILRFARPGSEPPALRAYGEKLAEYLKQNGVIYLDYSNDTQLTEQYYADPVHMNSAGQVFFTKIFGNDLEAVLK